MVLGGDKSMLLRFVRRLFSRKQVYSNYQGQRLSDSIEREILKNYFRVFGAFPTKEFFIADSGIEW